MANYSGEDVKRLAQFVLDHGSREIDISRGRCGSWYCRYCLEYENSEGKINHKSSCIAKVAQDVLTP